MSCVKSNSRVNSNKSCTWGSCSVLCERASKSLKGCSSLRPMVREFWTLLVGSTWIVRPTAAACPTLVSSFERVVGRNSRNAFHCVLRRCCRCKVCSSSWPSNAGSMRLINIYEMHCQASGRLSMKVVIFGSGSFGTAMATAVARNGHDVVVLSRSEEISAGINEQHRNLKYLTEFELLPNITSTCDPSEALRNCDFIIHSVPVHTPCLSISISSLSLNAVLTGTSQHAIPLCASR